MEELEFIPVGTTGVGFTAVYQRPVGRDNPTMVGPTVEVFVDTEREERKLALRFDPFPDDKANGPHYHYWVQGDDTSLGKQYPIDTTLVGDQVEWTMETLDGHLPAMLRRCGYHAQADAVVGNPDALGAAVDRVDALITPAAVVPA